MSVQQLTPSFDLVSGAPIIICPGNTLLAFQTSGSISTTSNVGAGFNQQNSTWWSYYWNAPAENVTSTGVQKLRLYC
jgi:hypothetical protein